MLVDKSTAILSDTHKWLFKIGKDWLVLVKCQDGQHEGRWFDYKKEAVAFYSIA